MPDYIILPSDPDQYAEEIQPGDIRIAIFHWDFLNVITFVENVMHLQRLRPEIWADIIDTEEDFNKRLRLLWPDWKQQMGSWSLESRLNQCQAALDWNKRLWEEKEDALARLKRLSRKIRNKSLEDERTKASALQTIRSMILILKSTDGPLYLHVELMHKTVTEIGELNNLYECSKPHLSCPNRKRIERLEEKLNVNDNERRKPMQYHDCSQVCDHEKAKCGCPSGTSYNEVDCARNTLKRDEELRASRMAQSMQEAQPD